MKMVLKWFWPSGGQVSAILVLIYDMSELFSVYNIKSFFSSDRF